MESTASNGADDSQALTLGVLFVDIADSTRMYRTLGDVRAREVVLACLGRLGDVVPDAAGGLSTRSATS